MSSNSWQASVDANIRRIIGFPLMSVHGEIAHASHKDIAAADHDLALCKTKLAPSLHDLGEPQRVAVIKRVLAKAQTSRLRNFDPVQLAERLCAEPLATAE